MVAQRDITSLSLERMKVSVVRDLLPFGSRPGQTPEMGGKPPLMHPLLRLLLICIPSLALYVGLQIAIHAITKPVDDSLKPIVLVLAFMLASFLLLIAYRRAILKLERRNAGELPIRPTAGAAWGLLIGLGLFATVQFVVIASGASAITGFAGFHYLLPSLAASFFAAVGEEIIFRGGLYRILDEWVGPTIALTVSAALFGIIHLGNPGATATGAVAIALEAGVLLGLAYEATGSLWLPIGIHLGWNFCEGGVFGSAVSATESNGIFVVQSHGSDLWTGGAFGLEASLPAVVICLLASVVFVVLLRNRPQGSVPSGTGRAP